MKEQIIFFLSLVFLSSQALADDEQINPDTARAYEGYLLTFIWPEDQSTEEVKYKEVVSTEDLIRFQKVKSDEEAAIINETEDGFSMLLPKEQEIIAPTAFEMYQKQLGNHVEIVSNQQWTLIFKEPGDIIHKTFYSEEKKDGYPELIGDLSIKLGRYLESDIIYKHFLFDSFTQPEKNEEETISTNVIGSGQSTQDVFFFARPIDEPVQITTKPDFKEFEPAFILTLEQNNKTASKKLNYLDHPTIGTLLYFEPISLEEAMERIALQSMTPETGASLDYDELQSTNELSDRKENVTFDALEAFDTQELFNPPVIFE